MKALSLLAGGALLAFAAVPASADTVCEWMGFTENVISAGSPAGSPRSPERERASTQVALAMFEALNAIDRRYESYLGLPADDAKASQDAAAATAAYKVLSAHYPAQKAALEESWLLTLESVRDKKARESGQRIGEKAATAALAVGGIDPAIEQHPYKPNAQPGVWTAVNFPVFEPFDLAFKPWVLKRADQVRPAPPPALTSERWARDLDEVKRLGAKNSKERTPHQTLMARYRITPNMMPSYRAIADAPGRRLVENARLFALIEMASDDGGIATVDAKMHYNFWRPVVAIRRADMDGNDATVPDPTWEPLIATPNHPEYPCGHCTFASVVATVLKSEVGAAPPGGVRVASRSIPLSNIQVLPTLDDWVREVSFSRTLGGVHYRFANEAGEEMGRKVGELTLASVMRPLAPAKRKRR